MLYNGSESSLTNVKVENKYSDSGEYDDEKEKSISEPDEKSIGELIETEEEKLNYEMIGHTIYDEPTLF